MAGFLEGNRIYLRPLSRDDLPARVSWINDSENIKTLLFDWPTSLEKTLKWYEGTLMSQSRLDLSIVDSDNDKLVGMTGLLDIDRANHRAQLYITIGNKKYRGLHIPGEVIPLVLGYGFTELELRRIYLYTLPENERARHVYERIGFKEEGVLREHVFRRGKQQDLHVHSILKNEYMTRFQ